MKKSFLILWQILLTGKLFNEMEGKNVASVSCSWWAVRTSNPEDAEMHSGSIPPPVCF